MTQSNTYGRFIKHLGWLLAANLVVFTRIYWCVHVKILCWRVGIATEAWGRRSDRLGLPGTALGDGKEGAILRSIWEVHDMAEWGGLDGILTLTLLAERPYVSHCNSETPCSLKNGGETSRLLLIRNKWSGGCRSRYKFSVTRPSPWAPGYHLLCWFGTLCSAKFWNASMCSLDQLEERAPEWFTWEAKLPRNGRIRVSIAFLFCFIRAPPTS